MVNSQESDNMTDDMDIEAMLEAPYRKGVKVITNSSREAEGTFVLKVVGFVATVWFLKRNT